MSVDKSEALDKIDDVRRRIVSGDVVGIVLVAQSAANDKVDALKWGEVMPYALIIAEKIVQLSKDQFWNPTAPKPPQLGIVRPDPEDPA